MLCDKHVIYGQLIPFLLEGPAGCGWVLYDMDYDDVSLFLLLLQQLTFAKIKVLTIASKRIASGNKYLGYNISNNQAEYQGLIDGLDYINEYGIECYEIYIRGDSLIVINQMEGRFNANYTLFADHLSY